MSNKEESTTVLGDSVVDSVNDPAGDAITAVNQRPEDGSIIPSSVTRQETGDVFKNEPSRLQLFKKSQKVPEETRSLSSETFSLPGQGPVLTGNPSGEDSPLWDESSSANIVTSYLRDVIEQCCVGKMPRQHLLAVLVDLNCRDRFRTRMFESHSKAADTRKCVHVS